MKQTNRQKRTPKKYYIDSKTTHQRYQDMITMLIPKGEDDPYGWWIYSYLKGNQIKIRTNK